MKPFTKRLALVMGLLFTALICMGAVFIDTVNNYWKFSGGFIQLVVNTNGINTNLQASFTVDTNTLRVGINTNNTIFGVAVRGALPPNDVASATGTSAINSGGIFLVGGVGGHTVIPTTGTGGAGGNILANGGAGGNALSATTNATGGAGGNATFTGGAGNAVTGGVATNATTGGSGGSMVVNGGVAGAPSTPSTNTVGGVGGSVTLTARAGGSPSAGWARRGGLGGSIIGTGGSGGTGLRTNAGDGGSISWTGGAAGSASTTPAFAGNGGIVEMVGGSGGTGDTNSDGAHVFIAGGTPGSGAVPGNVVLARTSGGISRGAGVQIGPLITGGSATITNVLGAALALDFPNTVAGTVSDLPITVTGVTSNNSAAVLNVAWQGAAGGGSFSTFASNDTIFCRFANNQLVSAIDPPPFTATVVVFRIR